MSSTPKYTPYYTYADYLLWEGKWELIEGLPYAMSPAPSSKHQRIAALLTSLFVVSFRNCKKCKVYQPVDWKVKEDTVLQPDMLIVCRPFNNLSYLDFPPVLVAEIVSPSSLKTDRREKFEIYESQGVKYYLIVDPVFNKLEIFENINESYQPVAVNPDTFHFQMEDDCSGEIDFSGLFTD
jgi:Uma2 family endonuclease